jgi:hypothetical protein
VVWQGSAGDRRPYADQIPLSQVRRREAQTSTRMLRAGVLVDRVLRFCNNYRPALLSMLSEVPEAPLGTDDYQ